MSTRAERNAELTSERKQLEKADLDIEQGRERYRQQQYLLTTMQLRGHDTTQAERLATLLGDTLMEWECHRGLILQRISHLEDLNQTLAD